MENRFIDNLLNRPSSIEVGQIWHIHDISEDVVITNKKDDHIIRVSVLSPILSLGDSNDIVMLPRDVVDDKIYAAHRVLLRITDRPILIKDLTFYKTSMKSYMIDRMIRSLSNLDFNYTDQNYKNIDILTQSFNQCHLNTMKYIDGK